MIYVEQNLVRDHGGCHRLHSNGEVMPPFRVNVEVKSPYADPLYANQPIQRPLSRDFVRKEINAWCRDNIDGHYHIGKAKTIHFEREEDALLFWFSFQRKT